MKYQEHIGQKISRLREIKGMLLEELATQLGVLPIVVRQIEENQSIEEDKLVKIAVILGVRVEEIKNFNSKAIKKIIITNTITHCTFSNQGAMLNGVNIEPNFNMENHHQLEPYKELYERLLQAQREKYELLMKKE